MIWFKHAFDVVIVLDYDFSCNCLFTQQTEYSSFQSPEQVEHDRLQGLVLPNQTWECGGPSPVVSIQYVESTSSLESLPTLTCPRSLILLLLFFPFPISVFIVTCIIFLRDTLVRPASLSIRASSHHTFKLRPQRLHTPEFIPDGYHALKRTIQLVDVLKNMFEGLYTMRRTSAFKI